MHFQSKYFEYFPYHCGIIIVSVAWVDEEIMVSFTSVFWMSFSRTIGLALFWFTKLDWFGWTWLDFTIDTLGIVWAMVVVDNVGCTTDVFVF